MIKIHFLTQGYAVDNLLYYPQPKDEEKLCEQRSQLIDVLITKLSTMGVSRF